ncbi:MULTISPECIES: hypothetical protein [Streptomyces]|uniref:Peptidase n=1 Tax=Streptomyces lycii TaxID=2654337 RepID=A0ABQ7FB40_9ACTN|nr:MULTISPECIES: hypothetical protein [Streptomyces]KAF4405021.1 hypothetical protein GCU69_32565 [Streptomyces lycii]PGH48421.1 hypothetical protein CRI70_23225 [Streptomyces sp. Ru87]
MRTSIRTFTGAAALALALTAATPLTAGAAESSDAPRPSAARAAGGSAGGTGTTGAAQLADGTSGAAEGVRTAAWGYQIMPSCGGVEHLIRQGANYWQGATETPGSGKPVECTNGYIADCFGTVNAVGCNYGPGRMIMLSTRVGDFALLAAHEFGHEWHPHSAAGCMNWASAYEVMRPTIC